MSARRLVAVVASVAGGLVLAVVLYLGFFDLSRHQARIEAFVTKKIGRPFAIGGPFKLKLLPSVSVVAEKVRVGNAEWGSEPQMVEIGRLSTEIGLWSLVSRPVDVRSLELSDVSLVLEKGKDGKGNWVLGDGSAPDREENVEPAGQGVTEVPAVIENGKLSNVRLTYREPGKPDRVALLETLTIGPGTADLLAISGKGRIGEYPATVKGDVGPLHALFSGRDIRMSIEAGVGNLRLDVEGGVGRLKPLDGADLTLKVENPDLGTMLQKLQLPALATGAMSVEARLKDQGDLTQVDVAAKLGDIEVKAEGTLLTLGLPGSDLRFSASVADAGRLAAVFDVTGLPKEALSVSGHVVSSRKEIRLDGITAKLAGAEAKADGSLRAGRDRGADIRFALTAESLARLRAGLPEVPFAARGSYTASRDAIEVKDIRTTLGKNEISGWAKVRRTGRKSAEIELSSPRLDLTPLVKKEADAGAAEGGSPDTAAPKPAGTLTEAPAPGPSGKASPAAGQEPAGKKPKGKYVFGEVPLPLGELGTSDVKLHIVAAEVALDAGLLKDVDGTMVVDGGKLRLEWRARGAFEGTLEGSLTLAPSGDGSADLNLDVAMKNVRAGLGGGEGVEPSEVPATSVEARLQARGGSPRQMAASANGKVLVTQGPGKVKSGLIGMFGSGIVTQLASKLNPFSAKDPYTKLDCSVTRVDVVDGQMKVEPVLMQAEKVTVTAGGKVDLRTEELVFDFNTRPRKGVGVSPGMFTNPFIKLDGTLANPRLGVGAKGVTSGGLAAATAGASIVAKGIVDRIAGEANLCQSTLEEATRPPKASKDKGKEPGRD